MRKQPSNASFSIPVTPSCYVFCRCLQLHRSILPQISRLLLVLPCIALSSTQSVLSPSHCTSRSPLAFASTNWYLSEKSVWSDVPNTGSLIEDAFKTLKRCGEKSGCFGRGTLNQRRKIRSQGLLDIENFLYD